MGVCAPKTFPPVEPKTLGEFPKTEADDGVAPKGELLVVLGPNKEEVPEVFPVAPKIFPVAPKGEGVLVLAPNGLALLPNGVVPKGAEVVDGVAPNGLVEPKGEVDPKGLGLEAGTKLPDAGVRAKGFGEDVAAKGLEV